MEMQRLGGIHSAYVVGLSSQGTRPAGRRRRGRARGRLARLQAESRRSSREKRLSSYKCRAPMSRSGATGFRCSHSNKVSRRQVAAMMAEKLGRELEVNKGKLPA